MSKFAIFKFKELSLIHLVHLTTAIPEITSFHYSNSFKCSFLYLDIRTQPFSMFLTHIILLHSERIRSPVLIHPSLPFPSTVPPKWQRPFLLQLCVSKAQHLEGILQNCFLKEEKVELYY